MKSAIKFIIAAALIGYLIKSGSLDFTLITKSLDNKTEWILCGFFLISNVLTGTLRWKNILQLSTDNKLQYLQVLKINWIGLLFNTVLPGSVSGDFIKLIYARDLDRENFSKTFLITSVLIDRILGLVGLLILLGLFSIMNYTELAAKSSELKNLLHFNFLVFIFVILFVISILLPVTIQSFILNIIGKLPIIAKHATKALEQIWMIGSNKKILFGNIVLSMIGQTFFILGFWSIATPFFETAIPFQYALTFIPLGLCTIAIPITPQGLGVGHVAFKTLFSYFGQSNGDSLFNLYFLSGVTVNLLGIIPYLLYRNNHDIKSEMQEFETN